MPPPAAVDLERRTADWLPDLRAALRGLYGDAADGVEKQLRDVVQTTVPHRPGPLVARDRARELEPDWFQRPERVGYICYAERFGGSLAGVRSRLGHLTELGVDVLHLMSVLRPRAGADDGGYAIDDYRDVDPRLGTLDDLRALVADLHDAGISLVLDLVMNHTSDGHVWARDARAGDGAALARYLTYPDRSRPDAYEATLPEVFPDIAPGSFTWVPELERWVWTTFNAYQWDLAWSNPDVLVEMSRIVLFLADLGVDMLRLDAVAFTGKRLGTNCQNQPEAHLVAQALRAVLGMSAPATVLLAEAIVSPDELVPYLGRHERERRECELAYHNQLMVLGWSMLAEGRTELARTALERMPDPPARTAWLTYVRCHDDIGWAISEPDAAAVGLDGQGHREFLAAWYRGDFWRSWARGEAFGANPETRDERTSGGTAALCGIAAALTSGDAEELDRAVARLLLLYGIAFGWGGVPMVYMGDELALPDDLGYRLDPERAHDSRWRHRPAMDWSAAADRHDPTTVAGRVWAGMARLVAARRGCLPLHAAVTARPVEAGEGVLGWLRDHPRYGRLLGLAEVAGHHTETTVDPSRELAPAGRAVVDLLAADPRTVDQGAAAPLRRLAPYQVRWLTADTVLGPVPVPPPTPQR